MGMRIPGFVFVLAVLIGMLCSNRTFASPGSSHCYRDSLEWLVADGAVIVRGVIVDLASDKAKDESRFSMTPIDSWSLWSIVTFEVRECLKGNKAERVKFAVRNDEFELPAATLEGWQKSQRELLWILKRSDSASSPPPVWELLVRHKTDLQASPVSRHLVPPIPRDLWGMPAVIPLGPQDAEDARRLAFMTIDLKVLKTPDEVVKAVRAAITEKQGFGPVRSHTMSLPRMVAHRTLASGTDNSLTVPVDRRLEEFARRLIQSPGDFVSKEDCKYYPDSPEHLRREGVEALRLFRTEKNLAFLQSHKRAPTSIQPIKDDAKRRIDAYLPPPPT